MRFLDTRTGRFRLVENPRTVHYAILSHVWAKEGDSDYVPEQTYQQVCAIQEDASDKQQDPLYELSPKIQRFCEVAWEDGYDLGWADSCCIDKTSSAELSEAINSMFQWYSYAGTCYAFLRDVRRPKRDSEWKDEFRRSEWFTRGWTLQELIAPNALVFLSNEWNVLGTKGSLAILVEEITGIDRAVLACNRPLEDVSVARRMSWAASRVTTREEDGAYSLMGIFGVNMPVIYGEGPSAFLRLQEEILKHIPDQTIFAWGLGYTASHTSDSEIDLVPSTLPTTLPAKPYLLASSPKDFKTSSHLVHIPRDRFATMVGISAEEAFQVFTTTPYGIQSRFPLVSVSARHTNTPVYLALLACQESEEHGRRLLALILRPQAQTSRTAHFVGVALESVRPTPGRGATDSDEPLSASALRPSFYRVVYLTLDRVKRYILDRAVQLTDIYIPHRPTDTALSAERDALLHATLCECRDELVVRLSEWSRRALHMQGYRISVRGRADLPLARNPLSSDPKHMVVAIANYNNFFNIHIGRCFCDLGSSYGLLGVSVSSLNAKCPVEDQYLVDEPHHITHALHVRSWAFRRGTVSTEVQIEPRSSSAVIRTLTSMKLTLGHEPRTNDGLRTKVYRLSVEIEPLVPVLCSPLAPGLRARSYSAPIPPRISDIETLDEDLYAIRCASPELVGSSTDFDL